MTTNIWFTADHHFGHNNIIRYCSRPFDNVREMNKALILAWNYNVGPRDTVYHLGDFALLRKERVDAILDQLNGRIHLIRGNHDRSLKSAQLKRFESVHVRLETKIDGQEITMSHYPMLTWRKAHYGAFMLHGHSHGSCKENYSLTAKRMDVGVDCNNYYPFHIDQVVEHMSYVNLSQ